MIVRLLLPAAALLGLALAGTSAGARASQDAHAELAARLVSVLPPSGAEPDEPDPFAAERAAGLGKRYPAKSAEIAAAFADRAKCSDTSRSEQVSRVMLAVAMSLSDDDLRAMIAFYTGPDRAVAEKASEGTPEWKALTGRYPLIRFGEAMNAQLGGGFIEQIFAAEEACDAALTAAFAKEGISE
ncbi:hypothetical protein [Sphingomonas soli]|uniref:hypothetical protein n=1 Tax=Sphingomonas soli TaxID=266127 RepID=UPI00082D979F|nr:hypothetical protein [Sphingomonas soli]